MCNFKKINKARAVGLGFQVLVTTVLFATLVVGSSRTLHASEDCAMDAAIALFKGGDLKAAAKSFTAIVEQDHGKHHEDQNRGQVDKIFYFPHNRKRLTPPSGNILKRTRFTRS